MSDKPEVHHDKSEHRSVENQFHMPADLHPLTDTSHVCGCEGHNFETVLVSSTYVFCKRCGEVRGFKIKP